MLGCRRGCCERVIMMCLCHLLVSLPCCRFTVWRGRLFFGDPVIPALVLLTVCCDGRGMQVCSRVSVVVQKKKTKNEFGGHARKVIKKYCPSCQLRSENHQTVQFFFSYKN